MDSSINWAGVITGTVTPFTEDGDIDWKSLERHADRLSGTGLVGILANAMMAEGLHLLQAERSKVLTFLLRTIVNDLPVIATIYGVNTSDAAEQAFEAASLGARALLVFPHPAFGGTPLDPAIPAAYFKAIWERASLPMIVFRTPPASGPCLDIEALKRLCDVPGVAAIKDSAAEASFYDGAGAQFLAPDSPVKILIDSDALMLPFLQRGAHGATSICAAVEPERYVSLFNTRFDPGAAEDFLHLSIFSEAVFQAPRRDFRARLKAALVSDQVITHAAVRAPLPDIDAKESLYVREALAKSRQAAG